MFVLPCQIVKCTDDEKNRKEYIHYYHCSPSLFSLVGKSRVMSINCLNLGMYLIAKTKTTKYINPINKCRSSIAVISKSGISIISNTISLIQKINVPLLNSFFFITQSNKSLFAFDINSAVSLPPIK